MNGNSEIDRKLPVHYTVTEVALILKRSRPSINELISKGMIDAYDAAPEAVHRQWRVTPEGLNKFIGEQSNQPKVRKGRRRKPLTIPEYV